jgi:hypothetical protein
LNFTLTEKNPPITFHLLYFHRLLHASTSLFVHLNLTIQIYSILTFYTISTTLLSRILQIKKWWWTEKGKEEKKRRHQNRNPTTSNSNDYNFFIENFDWGILHCHDNLVTKSTRFTTNATIAIFKIKKLILCLKNTFEVSRSIFFLLFRFFSNKLYKILYYWIHQIFIIFLRNYISFILIIK